MIVRLLSTLTVLLMVVAQAMAVELFRYRGAPRTEGRWSKSLRPGNKTLPMR